MKPLIILDIDGTIIGSKGHVEDCVWQAVEKAQAAGVKFAVCTGRPCLGVAQKIAKRLGESSLHVFQSGAQITYPSGEAVKVFALKEAVTRPLVEQARSLGLSLELYTPTTLFVERRAPIAEAHAKVLGVSAIVRDLGSVIDSEPVVRAQWVLSAADAERVDMSELSGVQISTATTPALKDTLFMSVTAADVSKGSATRMLAEAMKVDLEQTVGVGDSEGDVPMLEVVGYPVVMGNAPEGLRARYEVVAGDVDACGVVSVIEQALIG